MLITFTMTMRVSTPFPSAILSSVIIRHCRSDQWRDKAHSPSLVSSVATRTFADDRRWPPASPPAARYARGSVRGLLHHSVGHCLEKEARSQTMWKPSCQSSGSCTYLLAAARQLAERSPTCLGTWAPVGRTCAAKPSLPYPHDNSWRWGHHGYLFRRSDRRTGQL